MTRRLPFLQSDLPKRLATSVVFFVMGAAPAGAQEAARPSKADEHNAPLKMEAEQMTGRPDREVELERAVQIQRGSMLIEADRVHYDIVEDKVNAIGNVEIERSGDHYAGNALHLKMDTGVGMMDSPVYRLLRKNARGSAKRIDFETEDSAVVVNGIYTTCEGPDPDWYLKSSKLSLDSSTEKGTANNAVLVFKGVPIAGAPYISFPLSEERLSGFLAPSIVTSTTGGLEITTPYYLNIAPNRDLTLYPHYISRRGLMMGADARYLGETYSGVTRTEFLSMDAVTGEQRYALSSTHRHNLAPGLNFSSDLNFASDNEYPKDFPLTRTLANRRLLLRNLQLDYADSDWSGAVRVAEYQILQDPLATIVSPYGRLPQLLYSRFGYGDSGLSWNFSSEMTRFTHPTLVAGDRLVLNPRVTYALNRPGYFLRPSMSLHATTYSLNQADPAMIAPSRMLPTISLDSGLVFERDASFFGRDALQTLEPRLFYTYTPYVRQDALLYPNFDSSLADFNYAQVFRENRFVGNDRIGDSNLVTAALTSRFIELNGMERVRLAVAQRFYLSDQRVILGATPTTSTDTRSDILLLTSGRVTDELRLDANLQYSQTNNEVNRVNFGTYWQPAPMKLLNFQYRRDVRNITNDATTNFELLDISGQWPLSKNWYGVGRINYLLKENKIGQTLFGLEYKADCWIFRVVGQQIPTAVGVANTSFFIQLEFNGLSSLGSNPMRALRANVPGYQPLSQQQ
jgi:LPS-assembly protein